MTCRTLEVMTRCSDERRDGAKKSTGKLVEIRPRGRISSFKCSAGYRWNSMLLQPSKCQRLRERRQNPVGMRHPAENPALFLDHFQPGFVHVREIRTHAIF
jgi:hypothetical protein